MKRALILSKKTLILLCCTVVCLDIYGQHKNVTQNRSKRQSKNDVEKVMKRIVRYYSQYPQEKVYLHLDNSGYFEGETIWFSAYVTESGFTKDFGIRRSEQSRILYVELLNPSGDVVQSHKFPINHGKSSGQIHLDSLLLSGFYEIRAYTKYMMNWDDAGVFSRVIPIFSNHNQPGNYAFPKIDRLSYRHRLPNNRMDTLPMTEDKGKNRNTPIVHLYPEGGNLVRGLESKVAYTIIKDGKETLRSITHIIPHEDGEQLSLTDEGGKIIHATLPDINNQGCVVNIDNEDDELMCVKIQSSDSIIGNVMAFAILREGQFEFCDTFTAMACYERQFFRKNFRGGVNELVVFHPDGRLLCDRLFFIYPHKEIDSIDFDVTITSEKPCSEIQVELHGQPNSWLSFSATDAASTVNGRYGNIATYLLLGSEVRGYIKNPDYYFEADDSIHRNAADLLMLVQGWRRYVWTDMTGKTTREIKHEVEKELILKGQLKSKSKKNKPSFVNLDAYMFNKKGQTASGKVETDADGKFLFHIRNLGDGDFNLQIATRKENRNTDFWVTLDRHFAPKPRGINIEETEMIPTEGLPMYQLRDSIIDSTYNEEQGLSAKNISERNFFLPTVTIKTTRKILGKPNNITWYDESRGYRYSHLYYDCDKASDQYADKGMEIPSVYEWLSSVNDFFINEAPNDPYFERNPLQPFTDEDSVENDFYSQTNTGRSANIYKDGYSYKGRPIIWILNNRYAGMTSSGNFKLLRTHASGNSGLYAPNEYSNWQVLKPTIEALPVFLDDVKSIYISEDFNASMPYLNSSDAKADAVTIFLFTHPTISTESKKGLRKTHYQGFTTREEFEMHDYTVLPPSEDFRRTLYWNPDITTDSQGNALVKFYNNLSAKVIYFSAEGVAKDGKIMISK